MQPPVDPIIFSIGPLSVHWYGLLIVTGVLLGAVYASRRAQKEGLDPDHIWNGLIIAIIFAIVGARLYHVFSSPEGGMRGWSWYREHPIDILKIWEGGLGIYGAIAGAILGIGLYAWRFRLSALHLLDLGAPGLALGQFVGRWGNFINQELYGPPTGSSWWGLKIDPLYRIEPFNDLTRYPPDTLFHPTFLYESLWSLVLFIVLALVASKLRDRLLRGDIFLGYLIGYPLGRFFVEFFRPDAWLVEGTTLAAAQLVAIVAVVAATAVLVYRHVRVGRGAPADLALAGAAEGETITACTLDVHETAETSTPEELPVVLETDSGLAQDEPAAED